MNKRRKASRQRKISKQSRDWNDVPADILISIFSQLDTADILNHVQFVSYSWYKVTKDPCLFRSIVVTDRRDDFFYDRDFYESMKEGVRRSCGELLEFYFETWCSDELFRYVVDNSNSLRSVRLPSCYAVSDGALIGLAMKHRLLEELEFSRKGIVGNFIAEVGSFCKQLKCFRFSCREVIYHRPQMLNPSHCYPCVGFNIAETMHQLVALHISGLRLMDDGLQAILRRCIHLEYLDLQNCYLGMVNCRTLKKCVDRIKDAKLPNGYELDYINV